MRSHNQRAGLLRRATTALSAFALTAGTVLLAGGTASAQQGIHVSEGGNGTYLALGDSVAFGYIPPQATPPPNYLDPSSFLSYANYTADALGLKLTNASCPGETTASMINTKAISNGCENTLGQPGGYRTVFPLHVKYQGSQLAYAVSYLKSHPHTRLVTIDIGANDAFVCEETTTDGCTSPTELAAVLNTITSNLRIIYQGIRDQAHYTHALVAVNYYSLSYQSNPYGAQSMALSMLLNRAIDAAGMGFHVVVADGYGAFEAASANFGGSPCAAGLLVKVPAAASSIPGEDCNIHPSLAGHQVLAAAILGALSQHGYEGMAARMGKAA